MGKLAVALCVLVLASSAFAYPKIVNPTSLLGWWPMEEGAGTTTQDRSGNGNTGTLSGSWVASQFGKCVSFNGTSNSVDGASTSQSSGTFAQLSVCAWTRFDDVSATARQIVGRTNGATAYGTLGGFGLDYSIAASQKVGFHWNNGADNRFSSGYTPTLGKTCFIVATFESGGLARIYVDGSLRASTSAGASSLTAVGSGFFRIARWDSGGFPFYFKGAIDEVRIYNRALSASEIFQQYQSCRTSHSQ